MTYESLWLVWMMCGFAVAGVGLAVALALTLDGIFSGLLGVADTRRDHFTHATFANLQASFKRGPEGRGQVKRLSGLK